MCVKVSQFIFPVSFYSISSTNNTLIYYLDTDPDFTTLTIPEGDYTAQTLTTSIQTRLGGDFAVDYDDETMKFSFGHTTNAFTFDADSTCLRVLGFTENQDHNSDEIFFTLFSEYPIDLSSTNCLYVSIPNLSINNINGNTGQRTSAIACIPVSEETGDLVVYTNDTGLSVHTQEDIISEFHIRIYEEDLSTLANFQNQSWIMTIETSYV